MMQKVAHFRLTSVAQKCFCLSSLTLLLNYGCVRRLGILQSYFLATVIANRIYKGAFYLSKLTGQTIPIAMIISL